MALLTRVPVWLGWRRFAGWIAGEVMATDPACNRICTRSSTARSVLASMDPQIARHRAAVRQWRPWRRGAPWNHRIIVVLVAGSIWRKRKLQKAEHSAKAA